MQDIEEDIFSEAPSSLHRCPGDWADLSFAFVSRGHAQSGVPLTPWVNCRACLSTTWKLQKTKYETETICKELYGNIHNKYSQ